VHEDPKHCFGDFPAIIDLPIVVLGSFEVEYSCLDHKRREIKQKSILGACGQLTILRPKDPKHCFGDILTRSDHLIMVLACWR